MEIALKNCYLVGVKADIVKNTVRITLETRLDEKVLAAKRVLAILAVDQSPVDVTISEEQLRLGLEMPVTVTVTGVDALTGLAIRAEG